MRTEQKTQSNQINLAHKIVDFTGREVLLAQGGPVLTVRAALVESLNVQISGLAEQVKRADLAERIYKHKEDCFQVSGPTQALLGDAINNYPWRPSIVPDLLTQVDPGRLSEIRAKA